MEMYTLTFKPPAQVKDKWDLFTLSAPVPAASQSLEVDRADTRGEQLHDAGLSVTSTADA